MLLDIAPSEFVLIAAVAIVCIGPKDMPRALRTAGRWMGKMRRVSGHFRTGLENMIREAELEEMEKKWHEQNAAIMGAHPAPGAGAENAAASALSPHIQESDPVIGHPATPAAPEAQPAEAPHTASATPPIP